MDWNEDSRLCQLGPWGFSAHLHFNTLTVAHRWDSALSPWGTGNIWTQIQEEHVCQEQGIRVSENNKLTDPGGWISVALSGVQSPVTVHSFIQIAETLLKKYTEHVEEIMYLKAHSLFLMCYNMFYTWNNPRSGEIGLMCEKNRVKNACALSCGATLKK